MPQSVSVRTAAAAGSPVGYVEFAEGRRHWRVSPEFEPIIRDGTVDWDRLDMMPGATLVKQNTQRDVWRIPINGRDYFIKVYHPRGLANKIKLWLRGPTAVEEWDVGRYAGAFGIGSVVPVACGWTGKLRSAGQSILVTEAVPGARPLSDYWMEVQHDRLMADALLDSLARLIARAHQCGYQHGDMHPGNLLVRGGRSGTAIVFVDLHKVRTGACVSLADVVRNLAQLNQWFRRNATRSWRLRFLVRYLGYRDQFAQSSSYARNWRIDPRRLSADLARQADRHAQALWSKRDRRTLRDSRYFARIKPAPGWSGHVLLQSKHPCPSAVAARHTFTRSQWRHLLRDPLSWVDPIRHVLLKDSHTATICKAELPLDHARPHVIAKRTLARNAWKRLLRMFGPSRNKRAWRMANMLLNRDLPVAQPMAVIERYAARIVRLDSLLITDYVAGAVDLEAFIATQLATLPPQRQRRVKDRLIYAITSLLQMFNERGFVHRDLKAGNLLVSWSPPFTDPPRLTLIDMEGIRRTSRINPRNLLRAAVRLSISLPAGPMCTRTDRLRTLLRLLVNVDGGTRQWKDVWRDLSIAGEAKLGRQARRRQWKLRHYGRP